MSSIANVGSAPNPTIHTINNNNAVPNEAFAGQNSSTNNDHSLISRMDGIVMQHFTPRKKIESALPIAEGPGSYAYKKALKHMKRARTLEKIEKKRAAILNQQFATVPHSFAPKLQSLDDMLTQIFGQIDEKSKKHPILRG